MTQYEGKGPYHVEINPEEGFVRINCHSEEMLYWANTEWEKTPELLFTILEAAAVALMDPMRMTLLLVEMGLLNKDTTMRDEQVEACHFEQVCGGRQKAERLFRIWQNAYSHDHPNPRYSLSREQVFERQAKDAGFFQEQINAFYACHV